MTRSDPTKERIEADRRSSIRTVHRDGLSGNGGHSVLFMAHRCAPSNGLSLAGELSTFELSSVDGYRELVTSPARPSPAVTQGRTRNNVVHEKWVISPGFCFGCRCSSSEVDNRPQIALVRQRGESSVSTHCGIRFLLPGHSVTRKDGVSALQLAADSFNGPVLSNDSHFYKCI